MREQVRAAVARKGVNSGGAIATAPPSRSLLAEVPAGSGVSTSEINASGNPINP